MVSGGKINLGISTVGANKGFYGSSSSLIDSDSDNSFEINNSIYKDGLVQQCINYVKNCTLSDIVFDVGEEGERRFNEYRSEIEEFFIQYLIDGISHNLEGITVKNTNIKKAIYANRRWNIKCENVVYSGFDDKDTEVVVSCGDEFLTKLSEDDYDKFIHNDYLVTRKSIFPKAEPLQNLLSLKQTIMKVIEVANKKNAISTLLMYVDNVNDDVREEMQTFLQTYTNASASILNRNNVSDIDIIEAKTNDKLIFSSMDFVSKEICFLLGCSFSIFSASGTELATGRTINDVVNRNINAMKEMMEDVINEISEKNKLSFKCKITKIPITSTGVSEEEIKESQQS